MQFQELAITTSRINGLTAEPEYIEPKCLWSWFIGFSKSACPFYLFQHDYYIKVGNEEEESIAFYNRLKKNFEEAGITEGERVAVIFSKEGDVIAVSKRGGHFWVDFTDKFAVKTFKELNIEATF